MKNKLIWKVLNNDKTDMHKFNKLKKGFSY